MQIKTLQTAPRREAAETLVKKVKRLGFEYSDSLYIGVVLDNRAARLAELVA